MNCSNCPYAKSVRVPGVGPPGGLCIVGDAPGTAEVSQGKPFVGESGKLLREVLKSVRVAPERCYITNALLCQPYVEMPDGTIRTADVRPAVKAIHACRARLLDELESVSPTRILAVGAVAATSLLGVSKLGKVSDWMGRREILNIGGRDVPVYFTVHPSTVLRELRRGDDSRFREFFRHVHKWANHHSTSQLPDPEIVIDELDWLDALHEASVLSCDVETSGYNPFVDELLSVAVGAWTKDGRGFVLVLTRDVLPRVRDRFRSLFCDGEALWVFHNVKFDIKFLWRWLFPDRWLDEGFLPVPKRLTDTLLLHYSYDERAEHGLKHLALELCDAPDYEIDLGAFFRAPEDDRDYMALYRYNALDAYYTLRVYDEVKRLCREDTGDDRLIRLTDDFLVPAAVALAKVELFGVPVDVTMLGELAGQLLVLRDDAALKMREIVGDDNFNPGAWVQVARFLYNGEVPRHKSKYESITGDQVLKAFLHDPDKGEFCRHLLTYRKVSKILSTYIEGLVMSRDPVTGRVHTNFLLHGTATGRLSSRDPNLQNIPGRESEHVGAFRNVFLAPDGYSFVEADYSQLELRVAAWYSRDEGMASVFRDGRDIHDIVARAIFNLPEDRPVTKDERYFAKRVDFGVIYGLSPYGLVTGEAMDEAVSLGGTRWSIEDAQRFIDAFLSQFPKLRAWLRRMQRQAVHHGFVETPLGRRRRFLCVLPESVSEVERQAVNMPIQSLASDICLSALIRLVHRLPAGARPVLTVHDSILFEVKDELLPTVIPLIREEMQERLPIEDTLGIPFSVEIKVGKRWGDLKEVV